MRSGKYVTNTRILWWTNAILLVFLILYLLREEEHAPPGTATSNTRTLNLISASFKEQLIKQRLASYSKVYDNEPEECYTKRSTTEKEKNDFAVISNELIKFREKMVPYPKGYFHGRGIVLTIGPHQLRFTRANLKMIEHSGTRLPVQIWYSSAQIVLGRLVDLLQYARNVNLSICDFDTVECRSRTNTWKLNATNVYRPEIGWLSKHFPYKPAAIISATFAEVLFLDSDAYVVRDPEELFLSDPMYLHFGALFFPDAYQTRQHPAIWKILNSTCGEHEYELDSATILVNKERVWDGLYMTKLMNDNHKLFYDIVTNGDKDTFRLGFRYMKVKYYIVMVPCATGSFDKDSFCGLTICKTDSLAQHIYINHVHVLKYYGIEYKSVNLEYTGIGLGDPNDHPFMFSHCSKSPRTGTCFYVVINPNPNITGDRCQKVPVNTKQRENHLYTRDESLLYEKSRENQILISKTDNVMPNFIANLLQYLP